MAVRRVALVDQFRVCQVQLFGVSRHIELKPLAVESPLHFRDRPFDLLRSVLNRGIRDSWPLKGFIRNPVIKIYL